MDKKIRLSFSGRYITSQLRGACGSGVSLVAAVLIASLFLGGVACAAQGDTSTPSKPTKPVSEKQKIRREMAPVNPTPLGLEPVGSGPEKSPTNSQLQSEGTMDRVLHHLLGGPAASGAYTPPPSQGTTTAGGVPGGNWPGNWWIEGQGGGFNPNTSH